MSATVTPRDFMLSAYGYSTKNTPNASANEDVELFQVVIRVLRSLYAIAAEVNPIFFAESAAVAFASGGWTRPETAETIFYMEHGGTEVVAVPFLDRAAEPGKKAVYELGGRFFGAGNALDPTSGALTMYYSRRPDSPADADQAVDELWTESYNELVILQLALYLATKDGRVDEVAALRGERDTWLALYVAFLEHATSNLVKRFGAVQVVQNQSLTRFRAMLDAAA